MKDTEYERIFEKIRDGEPLTEDETEYIAEAEREKARNAGVMF